MVCNRARMYYKIGDWGYHDEGRRDRLDKKTDRRIAKRRLARELRRDPEGA